MVKVLELRKKPAYTSQEYSCCGYVDEKNRKDTQEFECKACGNKTNAQINGTLTKKQVLRMLIERYLKRLKGYKSPCLNILNLCHSLTTS